MQLILNGLIAGSLGALVAGGLALVYGVLGVFNLALGQMALIAGYVTWWLHQSLQLPLVVSIVGGLAVGALVSWVCFEIFVNPFYKRHRFLPLVTTIALSMILDGLILLIFEERPRSIVPGMKNTFDVLGARVSTMQISLVILTLVLLASLAYILHSTAFGRKIRAVVQHPHAAMGLGIRAPVLHRLLFILSGVLAGLGGMYLGIDQNLTPVFAFPITIKAYAAIIAGGKGNIWGAVLCAYIIAMLEQFAIGVHWFGLFYIPSGYQQTVALLFIIVFLIFRPEGLFASKQRTA
jgi:branched-subunit amino acid ABC-type transport system permease component